MSATIRVVKGTVVVEGSVSEAELLVGRYTSRRAFELWRAQHPSLTFLKRLPVIESLTDIPVQPPGRRP